jgi:hypothetical protein
MYYLKPNDSSLPLFLLFGDIHGSYDNMCPNCTCDDREGCCQYIHSISFIKKIESLAQPDVPIDFYIEYFEDDDDGAFESPLDRFRQPDFQYCYKRTVKNRSNCYVPGIRWHYSDIRMSNIKNNIETVFESLYIFIQFCIDLNREQSYEGVSMSEWLTMDKSSSIYKKYTGINISKKRDLHKIIDVISSLDELPERIVDFLFSYDYLSSSPSLIYKQFKKQVKTRVFADKKFIVEIVRKSFKTKFNKIDLDEELFEKLAKFDMTANYKPILKYLLHINSTLVDLYTVLRVMKKVQLPPSLCVAYMGDAHIINIVNILLSSDYYSVVASVEENNENRCLPFDIFDDLSGSLTRREITSRRKSRTSSTDSKTKKSTRSKYFM